MRHESDLLFHLRMLTDSVRMEAYCNAIAQSVRPGDVVVDLGSGTGILGLLAARAGAARVYCVEQNAYMVERARRIARDNGLDGTVVFLNTRIEDLTGFPEPIDVFVSETMGPAGIDEGIFQLFSHCATLQARQPRWIPDRLTVVAAPINYLDLAQRQHQAARLMGLDFTSISDELGRIAHILPVMPDMLAAPEQTLFCGVPGHDPLPEVLTLTWDLVYPVSFDAVGIWFSARLCEGVELGNPPEGPDTHWSQLVLPVLPAVGPITGPVHLEVWPRFEATTPRWKWRLTWEGGTYTGDPAELDPPSFAGFY